MTVNPASTALAGDLTRPAHPVLPTAQAHWHRRAGHWLLIAAIGIALTACSRAPEADAQAPEPLPAEALAPIAPAPPMAEALTINSAPSASLKRAVTAADSEAAGAEGAAPAQRFIAVSHVLRVEAPAADLAARWTAVRDACLGMDCELESSSLQRETAQTPAGASLRLRVAPKDFDRLMASVGGSAHVVSHETESEDKTAQVVDVEAHLKNRTEYRDSLRALLQVNDGKRRLADLLEIQNALSRTQAEIDSALTQRKLLARETSKQLVVMQFEPAPTLSTGRSFSPVAHALRNAGELMQGSVAELISAAAVALPWLVIMALAGWVMSLVWSLLRRRRAKMRA